MITLMDGTGNSSLFKYRAIPFFKREEIIFAFKKFSYHMLLMLALLILFIARIYFPDE